MSPGLLQELALLPVILGHHLLLSLSALLTGISICFPLAILVSRVKALQWPTLTFASIVQTIPGLALLALMVPLLGQIGFLPAFLALVLYSMLPILHNTVTGILSVDPTVMEAARGIGMTNTQQLLKVELPLAAPVIIAGIRTSAVWVIGTATLATPVGATSLGNYIFAGLQTQNTTAVLVGCLAAAALAVVLDQLIRLLENATRQRSHRSALVAVASLFLLLAVGLAPLLLKAGRGGPSAPVVVGAKTFTEQYLLAELLSRALRQTGLPAVSKTSLGSSILFDALVRGKVDCYVDYSGTLWANVMKRRDIPPRPALLAEMTHWLEEKYHVKLLGALGFENTYALAISKETSAKYRISSLEDLTAHAPALGVGSDYEFFSRPEWVALKESYRLQFAEERTFDPSLMYEAIRAGSVDVISAYSTDGRIAAYNLVVLQDPHGALPPYDAVLLLARDSARRPEVVAALTSLVGAITNENMRQANKMVDLDHKSIAEAVTFLWSTKQSGRELFNRIPSPARARLE
jgi:osmoprotectant transport system substrate-binding protein/osmoprotectant transport system permease protein